MSEASVRGRGMGRGSLRTFGFDLFFFVIDDMEIHRDCDYDDLSHVMGENIRRNRGRRVGGYKCVAEENNTDTDV